MISPQCARALVKEAEAWVQNESLVNVSECFKSVTGKATYIPEEGEIPEDRLAKVSAAKGAASEALNKSARGYGAAAGMDSRAAERRLASAKESVAEAALMAFAAAVNLIAEGARLPPQAWHSLNLSIFGIALQRDLKSLKQSSC